MVDTVFQGGGGGGGGSRGKLLTAFLNDYHFGGHNGMVYMWHTISHFDRPQMEWGTTERNYNAPNQTGCLSADGWMRENTMLTVPVFYLFASL